MQVRLVQTGSSRLAKAALTPDPQQAQKQLDQKMSLILGNCKDELSFYEDQAASYQWVRVGLAVLGGLAGSIGVPVATLAGTSTLLIGALGGIAGVTNLAQASLTSQGLTTEAALNTREGIRVAIQTGIQQYTISCEKLDPNTAFTAWYNCKDAAAETIQAACISYAIEDPTVKVQNQ